MNKIILLILTILVATPALACDHYVRKYATAATLDFCLWETDATDLMGTATITAGEVKIAKDEGAEANCSTGSGACVTDEGTCYSIALTSTEMTAARVYVTVIDTAAKTFLDKCLIVETFGNASAQFATPDVNVVAADGVATGSVAELSSVPGSTPTLLQMIQLVFEVAKHKLTSTSTTQTLYKVDDSTSLGTATLSYDGTTLTRGRLQ